MLWALGLPREDGLLTVDFPYFERPQALEWHEPGTYVDTDVAFEHNHTYEWNHGLGETVTALLAEGMQLTRLVEHDSVPWDALPGAMTKLDNGEWRLRTSPTTYGRSRCSWSMTRSWQSAGGHCVV